MKALGNTLYHIPYYIYLAHWQRRETSLCPVIDNNGRRKLTIFETCHSFIVLSPTGWGQLCEHKKKIVQYGWRGPSRDRKNMQIQNQAGSKTKKIFLRPCLLPTPCPT